MAFLKGKDKEAVTKELSKITRNIKLLYFTTEKTCMLCKETGELLEEVAGLHEKISVEVHGDGDLKKAKKFGIDKFPAFVITEQNEKTTGVRFFGIPAGYEFVSLLGALVEMGTGNTELTTDTKKKIAEIKKPVHIQVFVTPTCPYCPGAVRTGHQMAMLNPNIISDMIEAQEFPELGMKYHVMGVPRTVVNENGYFEGALPEALYVERVIRAVNGESGNLAADLH
ncbi:MAG: thioredoxin family protein [Deltaproteobacteria bacterium]|nr:thioredoxin family protein [Deltaproteobacteria bacterium]